jgi:hypothetical protein
MRRSFRCRLSAVKGFVVSRVPIPPHSFSDDQSRSYSFSDNVGLGEADPSHGLEDSEYADHRCGVEHGT